MSWMLLSRNVPTEAMRERERNKDGQKDIRTITLWCHSNMADWKIGKITYKWSIFQETMFDETGGYQQVTLQPRKHAVQSRCCCASEHKGSRRKYEKHPGEGKRGGVEEKEMKKKAKERMQWANLKGVGLSFSMPPSAKSTDPLVTQLKHL